MAPNKAMTPLPSDEDQDVGGSAKLLTLFRQVSFGDFGRAEVERLLDVAGLVPYKTYWQSPVRKPRTSMLFGSIIVDCGVEVLASTPTFETPVFIGGYGPISPPPLPEMHLFQSQRRLSGSHGSKALPAQRPGHSGAVPAAKDDSEAVVPANHVKEVSLSAEEKSQNDKPDATVATPQTANEILVGDGDNPAPVTEPSEPPSPVEEASAQDHALGKLSPNGATADTIKAETESTVLASSTPKGSETSSRPKSPTQSQPNGSPSGRKKKRKSQQSSPVHGETTEATIAEASVRAKSPEKPVTNGINGIHTQSRDQESPSQDAKTPESPSAGTPSPKKLFVDTTSAPLADVVVSPTPSSPTKSSSSGTNVEHKSPLAATAPKRWADLIKVSANTIITPTTNGRISKVTPMKTLPKKSIGAIIADIGVSYQSRLVHPRGLINRGNLCFINAILQPLLHTTPFYNAFRRLLLETTPKMIISAPLLDSMLRFWAEFHEDAPGSKLTLTEGDDPHAFAPEYVYTAVRKLRKIDAQQKGRQEDAEEFLGFILDGLHEELVSLQKSDSSESVKSPESDGSWVEVGKNSKNLVTRSVHVETSPVNAIFGGRLRSVVKCSGRKDSVTTEPFQALQLDIAPNHVHSIDDAIKHLSVVETLEGFTSPSKSNRLGTATKQNFLEVLPPVLILHLKRFVYDSHKGALKLQKRVTYAQELKIPTDLMPAAVRPKAKYIEYRLCAVVYHHGQNAAGGHYTCDVNRQSGGDWLRVDDACITAVRETEVVQPKDDRDAYMLFYTRT